MPVPSEVQVIACLLFQAEVSRYPRYRRGCRGRMWSASHFCALRFRFTILLRKVRARSDGQWELRRAWFEISKSRSSRSRRAATAPSIRGRKGPVDFVVLCREHTVQTYVFGRHLGGPRLWSEKMQQFRDSDYMRRKLASHIILSL